MSRAAPILELISVSKRFGGATALRELSLSVARGETTVLIGPSGSGKTTLLRLMLGLLEPSTGEVRFRGERLDAASMLGARQRMGYLVQDGGLFPHLTARENVTLMARYLRWEGAKISARVRELAELVRLSAPILDRYPTAISGGQKQRVALMRALMLEPELLFLDEPLGALDPLVRADLQADLAEIFRSLGTSVVLVTHDLAEAAFFGQTIVLLRDGVVAQCGTLDDLVRHPADEFVTRFVRAQRRLDLGDRGET